MTDTFHSCEITPAGISIKVVRDGTNHRRAIGLNDYNTKDDFLTAASAFLEGALGKDLALVAANVAAAETDASATVAALTKAHEDTIAAMQADHDATVAALQADLDALGTKEEAQAIRKQQAIAALRADIAAKSAELAKLDTVEASPLDIAL
jgi:Skp family chaperone for outer membrane proteins